jgi:hypothetical protein
MTENWRRKLPIPFIVYHKSFPKRTCLAGQAETQAQNLELRTDTMRRLLQTIPLVLMLAGAILLFQQPAYAYADPGTGLLAIQAVGSAVVAVGWYLRRKIYALFHRAATGKPPGATYRGNDGDEGSSLP